MDKVYFYGMRLRPFGPSCQPKEGFIDVVEDYQNKGYHNILMYERRLSEEEISNYELDFLEELNWAETYKKWAKLIKEEYKGVDIDLVHEYVDKALREGIRDVTIVMAWVECETGAIPLPKLEMIEEEYYMANHKLYNLKKAKMIYKASPVTEYYISEKGNYFAVELIYPDNTGEEPLSKDNIKNITDLEEADMINTLIQNNEIILLATEFPKVFRKLELA